jgi:hypothetical protein
MTVGWIFEGDRDRFLAATQPSFQATPYVPAYQCPFCKDSFRSRKLLSAHLESMHVVKRPFLLMAGREPNSEDTIRANSIVPSLETFNCTELSVGVDGEALRRVQPSKLIHADHTDAGDCAPRYLMDNWQLQHSRSLAFGEQRHRRPQERALDFVVIGSIATVVRTALRASK